MVSPSGGPVVFRRVALFSMLFLSLIMRPWVLYMRVLRVAPRALADDVRVAVVSTIPERSLRLFCAAYEATLASIDALGPRPSPSKSLIYSSSPWLGLGFGRISGGRWVVLFLFLLIPVIWGLTLTWAGRAVALL